MALLSQFVHHHLNGRPCARFFVYHQGFEFIDVACCTTFFPYVCLHQRQTFGNPDSDTFRLFGFAFQVLVRQQTFSRLFSHQLASMWWKPILFRAMTNGPSSSKSDLTLIKSVTPLRSSISWKRIDHGCSTSRRPG